MSTDTITAESTKYRSEFIADLAKAESGALPLELGAVSLNELREAMAKIFIPIAVGQATAFWGELDDTLPARIVTDPHRLRQILTNLLTNAFQFTADGKVVLRMERCTGGWDPANERLVGAESVIAMSVRDTGIGIETDRQEVMFEAFARVGGTTVQPGGETGAGLGLSISRRLAELLGGEIAVVSSPGEGSTFTLFLPLEPVDADAAFEPALTPSPAPTGTGDPIRAGACAMLADQVSASPRAPGVR